MKKTRYTLLAYEFVGRKPYGVWRIIDRNTGGHIGPQYQYECELLADLDRMAEVYGY